MLGFISFSPTRLINSIKHEHLCKILYFSPDLTVTVSESGPREVCVTAATETEYLLPG